ncbi:MAG TPA: AAA family ATPase [Fibrobacteria bacterium]|nr:AAA family ATPase [Fibrobacteria bacterium]
MTITGDPSKDRPYWFVGAMHGGGNDQTPRFLRDGIWENGYETKLLDQVKSMQPGDKIAIKAAYVRKKGLPFDNHGHAVSVMAIKAIGTIRENIGDGRTVRVEWTAFDKPREWYFYTHRGTLWRVLANSWRNEALIGFAFGNRNQDHAKWRNEPFWRERFGDGSAINERYAWTKFYEAIADGLRPFRNNRPALLEGLRSISRRVDVMPKLNDKFQDGSTGPLKDICPFTVIGTFNRHITDTNRTLIATELAAFLGIKVRAPRSFDAVPILNNQRSWLFAYAKDRRHDDIDSLWQVFEAALDYVEFDTPEIRDAFIRSYDDAGSRRMVGWNLTLGLFWIRPWDYVSLDSRSRAYITQKLGLPISKTGLKHRCSAVDYLAIRDSIEEHFHKEAYPVQSFPDVFYAAYVSKDIDVDSESGPGQEGEEEEEFGLAGEGVTRDQGPKRSPPIVPYSILNILEEGCFLQHSFLESLLSRLRLKRNLILQGPPGTGKTWLAKRLGYALMGQKDESKLRAMQFHPNLSYEDFVRGWRPQREGSLALVDGPFMEMVLAAIREPGETFVVIIEEINRGNPAQILGEMLTLLEADKRTPSEALALSHRRTPTERVHIPSNLFVIGTMNLADRSLALVDLALRRRFAFVDLQPELGDVWRNWVSGKFGIDAGVLADIEKRIQELNGDIASDSGLGRQFRIGHSYVTPPLDAVIPDAIDWFRQVVETEIGPLLEEYWFDASDKVKNAKERLLRGL